MRRAIVVTLLLGLSFGTTWAQRLSPFEVEAAATRALAAIARDDALLELAISNMYGPDLSPDKRAIAKSGLRAEIQNDRLPRYMAQLIVPIASPTLLERDAIAYVAEGMVALRARGLRRLPTDHKAELVRQTMGTLAVVPATVCKAMVLGKLDPRTRRLVAMQQDALVPLRDFEALVALSQAATEAELAEYPAVRTINEAQAKAAERAFMLAVEARIKGLPAGTMDRMQDLETAHPVDACRWGRLMAAASLDLTEPYRGWWLSRFVEGLQ
jgi:hypothetical protein